MIQQAEVFESDAVILDLEDSVLHYDKDAARDLVKNFIQAFDLDTTKVYIRLNDINTPFFSEDIHELDKLQFHGYVMPKASVEGLRRITSYTSKSIIPIIESPIAVLEAKDIAMHPQVTALLLGAEDLTKEMSIERTKQGHEIDYARQYIAIVCHAYQKEAIDTPWVHKEDLEGLLEDATYAKSIGFTAKALIHPNHVDTVNQIFVPTQEELEQAKRIVQKAAISGKGAFSLDGQMIDAPIIEKAKKLLAIAKRYDVL
jgi:citrate lyase subunit beta/citryl-CoA lyase